MAEHKMQRIKSYAKDVAMPFPRLTDLANQQPHVEPIEVHLTPTAYREEVSDLLNVGHLHQLRMILHKIFRGFVEVGHFGI